MSALPTLRSGDWNTITQESSQAWHCQQLSTKPLPALPLLHPRAAHSHSKGFRILGCQLGMGAGEGAPRASGCPPVRS